jgi:hypothetical protein
MPRNPLKARCHDSVKALDALQTLVPALLCRAADGPFIPPRAAMQGTAHDNPRPDHRDREAKTNRKTITGAAPGLGHTKAPSFTFGRNRSMRQFTSPSAREAWLPVSTTASRQRPLS